MTCNECLYGRAKYGIGDTVHLFGFDDWPCVITAVTFRASGQIEYQLEWNNQGEPKAEWFEEKRLQLLNNMKTGGAD